ncbi:MAG: hypothetical protein N2692_00495 [Patescibacteria group bacterium]|jgi:hypothetical protein|nr:hypothetical protein [Patescibacteria group bacterium]
MSELMEKGTAAVCYLLAVLKNEYHRQWLSRTVVQKLLFLFSDQMRYEWGYHLKNSSGPHSELIDLFLSWAEAREYIAVKREGKNSWFIFREVSTDVTDSLNAEDKQALTQIIQKFQQFKADELGIITLAVYMRNNYQMEDKKMIIDAICDSRPFLEREEIKKLVEVVI